MNSNNKNEKQNQDATSAETSVNAGKQAIDAAKKTAPREDKKKNQSKKRMRSAGGMKADGITIIALIFIQFITK